ncbi:MAG: DUF1330 domain-containing protein [Alphaproteobacteria bacterium]|nr:DUF1330 domain-containing protein [Alphaproteobacteria bacterium]
MTVYIVAQLTIKDPATYGTYQSRFMEVFAPFGGTLLAVDDNVKTLEGTWPHTRMVLASFPDEASLRAWWDSPAYREIVTHRQAASDGPIVLLKGLPGQ